MPLKIKSWRRLVLEIGAVIVAAIMLSIMFTRLQDARGYMLASGQPMFGDFIAFWCAGDMANHGQALMVHDNPLTRECQHRVNPDIRVFAPYNSPPTFLLFESLLARLPYGPAALTFLAISFAIFLFAAYKLLPDKRALLFAITLPAAIYHPGSIQTGLYIAGVTGLALYWLDKRPRLSGAMVALLAIKPHMAILWPIFLALSGRWKAFGAAAIAVTIFVVTAGLVWGWQTYPNFIHNLDRSAKLIADGLVAKQTYGSLFGNLLGLKVPKAIALGAHIVSAVSAFAMACWIFRKGDWRLGGAALCAATMLMSPYLFFYDSTLLALGAALLAPPRNKLEFVTLLFGWGAALSVAVGIYITLPIVPTAAWLILICALRRLGSTASAPALAPHT